jgi:TonB family protein
MEALLYLGKVNLFWVIFYLCYLLLRKHTFFKWNRAYLIFTLVAAPILPSIRLPQQAAEIPVARLSDEIYATMPIPGIGTATTISATLPQNEPVSYISIVWSVLVCGSLFMLMRFFAQLKKLRSVIRNKETIDCGDYILVLLPHSQVGSFSFFKWIILNRNDYEHNLDLILRHEAVHIRQMHSLDILLVELLKMACWFNPALWFYKKSLLEVHEFLADEHAGNKERYARFLVSYALNVPAQAIGNHFFNSSLIKNRISMIYKNRTSRWLLGKYFVLIPVATIAVLLTAARKHVDEKASPDQNNVPRKEAVQARQNITASVSVTKTAHTVEFMDIKGSVKDENGNLIPNVTLVEKGEPRGVNTDLNGEFEFKVVRVNGTIAVSHVSFTPYEFVVQKTKTAYQIQLKKAQNLLTSAVVVAFIKKDNADPKELNNEKTKDGFFVVEQQPEFPGGTSEMWKFIGRNTRYPTEASKAGVQGKALISFTVNENGSIRNPRVIKGLGSGIDEEAIRMVLSMPRWTPAKQNGQAVAVEYTLPIEFKLEYENKEKQQGFLPATQIPFYQTLAKNHDEFKSRQNPAIVIVNGRKQELRGLAAMENLKLIPAEIETINVLKNGVALGKYGADGSNGAIEITTRKH